MPSPGRTTYYVDPARGDDAASGTEPGQPWRSLGRVNRLVLSPGDRVELKPGRFAGSLQPSGGGTAEQPVVIRFAPGEYDFFPEAALKVPLHISNANDDPHTPKAIALAFVRIKHLRVEGGDAGGGKSDIFVHGKMIYTLFDEAEGVEIRGMGFDYRRPTTSEYTLAEAAADHAVLEVHPDSTYTLEDGRLVWVGEGWDCPAPKHVQEVDPVAGKLWRVGRAPNPLKVATRVEELAPRRLRVSWPENPGLVAGHVFQDRNPFRDCVGSFARRSKDIVWTDCAFYYMHGLGLVSQFCENLTVDRCRLAPRAGGGRTCACWADAIHVSGCKGKVRVTDSVFSGLQDDPLNVHGTYLRIVDQPADNQILVRFMHFQTYGFQAFAPGDEIEFVSRVSLCDYASARVKAAEMLNEKEFLLTLEQSVPAYGADDLVDNVTWTPSVEVRGCLMERTPVRGCLLSTKRPVLVENNTFLKTAWSAILNETDANKWFESGRIRDLVIRHNRFIQCGEPVIYIIPANQTANPDEPVHHNIRIEDNVFELCGEVAVSARSVKGLSITGNRFSSSGELPVQTVACTDVQISGNTMGVG